MTAGRQANTKDIRLVRSEDDTEKPEGYQEKNYFFLFRPAAKVLEPWIEGLYKYSTPLWCARSPYPCPDGQRNATTKKDGDRRSIGEQIQDHGDPQPINIAENEGVESKQPVPERRR
jgi:hypothetical protein